MKNKKAYIHLWQRGFTYIESILAISMTLMASTAIAFSVQKAISTYKSIELKDKAAEELIKYTEDYRMLVAYGEELIRGKQPPGKDGYRVLLYDAAEEREMKFAPKTKASSSAYLFHDIRECDDSQGTLRDCGIEPSCESGPENYAKIYRIRTWIEWDDPFDKAVNRISNRKNLAFEVYQTVLVRH